jgi:hypothetical protein
VCVPYRWLSIVADRTDGRPMNKKIIFFLAFHSDLRTSAWFATSTDLSGVTGGCSSPEKFLEEQV